MEGFSLPLGKNEQPVHQGCWKNSIQLKINTLAAVDKMSKANSETFILY